LYKAAWLVLRELEEDYGGTLA